MQNGKCAEIYLAENVFNYGNTYKRSGLISERVVIEIFQNLNPICCSTINRKKQSVGNTYISEYINK